MARDSFDESKTKKKKTTKAATKPKSQSSSVSKPKATKVTSSVNKTASKSTFLGGGASTQNVKKATTNNKPRTVKKQPTQQERINQKTYGTTTAPTRRTKTATTNTQRNVETKVRQTVEQARRTRTEAQQQKLTGGVDAARARRQTQEIGREIKSSLKNTFSDENRAFAQRQKSGILTEADKKKVEQRDQRRAQIAKNTGAVAWKAAQDTVSGYGQSLADVDEMVKSNKNWTKAKAQKMGIDLNDKAKVSKVEQERQQSIKEAREFRQELFNKQEKRQAEWDERTKNAKGLEKAWYGAVESGTGMLADTAVGAVTGTGQFGALASMGLRTYGSSANQARKEGATDKEARLYGLAQSAKEVGTELMFQGAGLAKAAYGKTGLSLADKSANVLTRGLTGLKADAVGAGVRALGGTAEENVEELAGWMADPLIKELTYGKAVRNRMKENLRSNIPQIGSGADAANVASYFSTPKFTDDLTKEYIKSGMSKDKASALAAEMRDYYVAYYSGDKGKTDALEEDLAAKLSGQDKLSFKSWSMDELKDTLASTTLLTLATGLPGAVTTSAKGNQIFDSDEVKAVFGNDAVKKVADAVKNTSNREMSLKADVMKQRLDSGKDLTGTQKFDLYQGYIEKVNETSKKARASYGVVENAREEQDLVPTMGVDRAGNTVYAKETQREYDEKYASTAVTAESLRRFMESDNSISDDEIRRTDAAIKAVSDLHVGGLTIGDAHEFAYGNTLARETLKAEEGIDLDRYIVRDANGNVDLAATNEATENALFKINADNAIKAAQAETEVYIDDTRGNIDKDLLTRFGNSGQAAWKEVNKDLDPRDLKNYLTTANAASYFYSAGRNTDMSVDTAIDRYADTFKTVDNSVLEKAFAAGAEDRIIANTPGYGQTVEAGSNIQLKKTEPVITGQLIMDDDVVLPDSDQSAYLALAMSTNTNIHIVSDLNAMGKDGKPIINQATGLPVQLNGMSHGNDIYLNMNEASEKNLGYVFMHEMTHQIKQYAPNEYLALENLVRDKWFNKDATGMQAAIKQRMDLYSVKGGQQLTEEEAVEEIIADAMAEAMDDPNFAAEVCEQDINLGQQILDSIRAALRSIRQMFANSDVKNDRFHNSLLSYLGILDDAEKMWLNALATARQNKANGLIADWQDKANKQNAPRLSVTDSDADYMKAVEAGDIETAQKMVDEAARNAGYTVEAFHGTKANFNKFRKNSHFGSTVYQALDRLGFYNDILDEYEDDPEVEELLSRARDEENAKVMRLHIKAENPIRLRDLGSWDSEELREGLNEVGIDLPTDYKGADIVNALKGLGYDSIVYENLREGRYEDEGENDAYILFDPRQAKLADPVTYDDNGNVIPLSERFNQKSPDIRFSLSEPVERVADLIAVHNLKPDDIRNTFELGGFPMPSIAITKDSMGHDLYGDITLMFHSDTVDPEFFKSNQVFGGDAWTPTFPTIAKKVSRKVADKVDKQLKDILGLDQYDYTLGDLRLPALDDDNLTNALRYNEPYEAFKNDEVFQIAYLKNAKNFDVAVPTKEGRIRSFDKQALEYLDDNLPELTYNDIYDTVDHTMQYEPAVRKARKDYYENKGGVKLKALAKRLDEEMGYSDVISRLEALIKFREKGIPEVTDHDALKNILDENVDQEGYKAWIDNLFEGIIEKTGIRNDKDMFFPSGKRRSWEQMHDPVTLENVVKVMKSELAAGSGIFGGNPKGAAQKQYKSLDEIRDDEDRLQSLPEEEYEALSKEAVGKMSEVCVSIAEHNPKRFTNSFGAALDVGSDIAEILNSTRKRSTIQSKLEKDYLLDVTDEQMDDLMDAIDAIANLPTGYFEAKPRRAVGFDEVQAAIIPQNTDEDIKTGLTERGIATYEYDPDVEGDRTAKVNEAADAQNLRFSITDSEGNTLSEGQATFFADSKMVDAEGRLKPMYHGTQNEFYEFDITKAYPGTLGRGFYFSDSDSHAGVYGKTNKYYLNLVNPLMPGTNNITRDQLHRFVSELAEDEDYGIENYGYGATVDSVVDSIWGKSDFAMLRDLNLAAVGDFAEALKVFNRVNGTEYDGIITDIETLAFYPQQVKSVDNLNPTLSKDTRYSITDSDGKELTDGQVEYFKNSQARDSEGKMQVVYHTTNYGGFTIFDPSYSEDRRSIFFTDSEAVSKTYGAKDSSTTYECYLNFENPLIVDADYNAWDRIPMTRRNGSITITEDYDTIEVAAFAYAEGYDSVIIRNCRDWAVDDSSDFDTEENSPYSDIFIAFSSEQVKDINNENPTENPDIRYSITPEDEAMEWLASQYELDDVPLDDEQAEEGRVRMAKSKKDFIKSKNALWNERWLTEGKVINVKSVRKNIKDLVTGVMANSDTDHKYKGEVVDKTLIDAKSAYWLMKEGKHSEAAELLWNSAVKMIENVDFIEDTTFKQYKDLRDYMRTTSFKLGEEYWSDVDFNAFRKRNFGRIKLVKGETNIDEIYKELQEKWSEWFDEDEQMTAPDQLLHIEEVLDAIQPYKIAYSSEEAEQLAGDIADVLYDIVYQGEEYKSIADTFKERYDAKTKALKARHEEALAKVRTRRDELLAAEKEKTSRQKERAELWKSRTFEEKAKRQKDKDVRKKAKYFGKISDNIDWLSTRLLNETKDKNIPEGFRRSLAHMLMQFDMQTEKSKKLEEKYGPAKKTLQMRELKSRLEKIANEDDTGEFRYDGYLFYLMDALAEKVDGKTIDALDTEDLIAIDTMLKSIVHNFRNYNKIRLEEEKVAIANIGDSIIAAMAERIKKYGKRKSYGNSIRGYIDRLINEGEETPIYFFERLDPTGQGIGAMYKELRRGEDRHIQNMNFLRNRFKAMFSDYFNEKKPGSKLESWRDTSQAQTFNLKNGSITLNPAQIMSLYCLTKRQQALGHILGAGIVASPISFGAKMQEKFKGKEEQVDSVMIEYSEVQEIIATLTEDQVHLADEMQALMNNEMAAWGNETSLELHGIKLFREKDYFPIKASNEVLDKSADKRDVNEKIKNFGFTKPLTRNANNAIMIDDIFSVVADHCNKMSLYNSMAIPITDFMRVYNYKQRHDDGSVKSVQAAIGEAFTRKANSYIMKFISDVNGNTKTRSDAVDDLMNKALANYKKASIGLNGRVALQQITAIFRARMVIDGKYFIGTKLISPKDQKEMFEHCPIALWKSWGHYDMDMGRDIEDIMMNNDWSKMDTVTMGVYGMLDNMAWGKIWQAVKKEIKTKHPEVQAGSDEFFRLCNERASEIFDKTQVVDSIFHRSDVMRSKNTLTKMATSFMAEPTLTYNVFRDSIVKANEMRKDGNVAEATKLLLKMMRVLTVNAIAVGAAAAIWDVVRGKGADDDDDDENLMEKGVMALLTKLGGTDPWTKDEKNAKDLWLINFLNNFSDNAPWAQWNNIYFVKDIVSLKDGWGTSNMALEGWETLFKGATQAKKKLTEGSDKSWYDIWMNIAGGLGYLTGYPVKTFMRDTKAILEKFGVEVFAADGSEESTSLMDSIANKMGYRPIDKKGSSEVKVKDSFLAQLGIGKTEEEKEQDAFEKKTKEIADKYADLSGEERDKKVWSSVTTYLKEQNEDKGVADMVTNGDYITINKYRQMYLAAGGNAEYFDNRILAESKKALKKSIKYNQTSQEIDAQDRIKSYMMNHGVTEQEISEIAYKSETAKDMKIAFIINDKDAMLETLEPLVYAGLTYEDLERLWTNRNRIDVMKYKSSKGRYADRLKSTGKFIWPTDGVITSHFGYRNAPTAGASSNHPAIDIGAPQGTAVVAADGGVVISAGANGGYGNSVGIKHDNGMITWYNHLYDWNVKVGDTVAQGQQIAQVGSTGISTGPHLDFKIMDTNGKPVDPEKYLN